MNTELNTEFMKRALSLAERGTGYTSPNPLVGCVIVKNGRIIGEGWHRHFGGLHAEREAFNNCTESTDEADMYVTLEPCCHSGKQPPCTDAIIKSGIKRVFVGSDDPNPLVSGRGISLLRKSGIIVQTGILKEDCDALNRIFFHYIVHKTPYVTMKYAMTLDGKISAADGRPAQITGAEARRAVHMERLRHTAIMVGSGTVLSDDPLLTCRTQCGRDPVRIVCDTRLRTPLDSRIIKTAGRIRTIIAAAPSPRRGKYEAHGAEILELPCGTDGHIDLKILMRKLGKMGIDSILLEGGSELNCSMLSQNLVNYIMCFIAPKIFGGRGAKTPVGGAELPELETEPPKIKRVGRDLILEGAIKCLPE